MSNEEGLAETAAAIDAAGGTVSTVPADVSKQADVDAVVAEAARRGPVTILANVAGVADYFLPVGELDDDTWERNIADEPHRQHALRTCRGAAHGAGRGRRDHQHRVGGGAGGGAAAPRTPRRSTA